MNIIVVVENILLEVKFAFIFKKMLTDMTVSYTHLTLPTSDLV